LTTPTQTAGSKSNNPVALQLEGITKRFGSITALDDVSLSIRHGAVHALLGENGAGKTTLMRIAFGMIPADSGSISIDGVRRRIASPRDAIARGIGMVHQQFSLVPAMTVAENVALGGHGVFRVGEVAARLEEIGHTTGLALDPNERVMNLGSADRQKLEIIRTIAHDASIMILDEPTAVLTPGDSVELFLQIESFAARGGSVVLITHKLRDALEHAHDVTVLRHGKVVMNESMNAVTEGRLANAMLGSAVRHEMPHARPVSRGMSVASLHQAVVQSRQAAIDLELFAGEVVGIAALDGAARGLLRVLSGRSTALSGSVSIPDRIGFVPENRRDDALIPEFSLTENLALAAVDHACGLVNWSAVSDVTTGVIRDFDVRTTGPDATPEKLSGGNQQRFVLGRELHNKPPLLILENPTQGLDLNAAAFVHQRMQIARDSGMAIVFYSSDLDELASQSDRVLVVSRSGIQECPPDRDQIGGMLLESRGRVIPGD
jgi:simple sugar transport system ATP-binding protein